MSLHEMSTGAVRSNDLKGQRWDLISGVFLRRVRGVGHNSNFITTQLLKRSHALISEAQDYTYDFLSGTRANLLEKAAIALMIAIEKEYGDWEIYQAAYNKHGFLFPFTALQSLAETLDEGANKYGIHNWLLGMQVSSCLLNHGVKHLFRYQIGDRSENHLGHALWGYMTGIHMNSMRPDMCIELLDVNYTLTPAIIQANLQQREKYHGSARVGSSSGGTDILHLDEAG